MSTWPAVSALDSTTQTFPVLTDAQIERVRPLAGVSEVTPGEVLFQPGDLLVPFFVILSGQLDILQPGLSGERLSLRALIARDQRISENPAIELHLNSEIQHLEGDTRLERVHWIDKTTGEDITRDIRHVFIMAGASPRTEWLKGCVALDDKGFILTGRDLVISGSTDAALAWPLARAPQLLETSLPGVFAVGDVRSGSVKRVASAVGEGAIAVHPGLIDRWRVHKALSPGCFRNVRQSENNAGARVLWHNPPRCPTRQE